MITPELARLRARLIQVLRSFFDRRDYLEVDTPALSPTLIPEPHIEVFRAEFVHPYQEHRELFLTPSPEIWMKRLLTAEYGNIYQLSHSFRNAESISEIHNPEFTMLEWYTLAADYRDSADLTETLLETVHSELRGLHPEVVGDLPEVIRMTMAEACHRYAGISDAVFADPVALRAEATRLGISGNEDAHGVQPAHPPGPAATEDLFQRLFLTFVEPRLPRDLPVIITDYPSFIPTLASQSKDPRFSERWELYLGGMEIANCYTEERNQKALQNYLKEASSDSHQSLVSHPPATDLVEFAAAPACSGVALGVDRLLAAMLGRSSIQGVIFFPGFSIFRGHSDNRGTI